MELQQLERRRRQEASIVAVATTPCRSNGQSPSTTTATQPSNGCYVCRCFFCIGAILDVGGNNVISSNQQNMLQILQDVEDMLVPDEDIIADGLNFHDSNNDRSYF